MLIETTIRSSQSGWIVYFNRDSSDFKVFRSDEPERMVKFLAEKVAGISLDQLIASRQAEIAKTSAKWVGERP